MSVNEKLTAIADTIRGITGGTEKLGLDAMAQGVTQVYDEGFEEGFLATYDPAWNDGFNDGYDEGWANGKNDGYTEGKQDGFADGKQAGADAMWDSIQDYGNKKDYRAGFFYCGFSHFDPKYFIAPTNADSMFSGCSKLETVNWEKLDLTTTSSLYSTFAYCSVLTEVNTDLAVVKGTATLLNSIFRNCFALQRVKKLTAFPAAVWKQSFENCKELTHIIFVGTIGANGLDMHWSTKLDKESIASIINCLSDTTEGLSITLSETAVNQSFGYEEILDDSPNWVDGIYSGEWNALVDSKPNWTISLV